MKQKITIEIICFMLTLLFMYAALSKLLAYKTFQNQLSASPLLNHFSTLISWAVPVSEIIISALLTMKPARLIGSYAALILLSIFTAYIVLMLLKVPHLPCSCGGIIKKLSWKQHILFNSLFIILSITGIHLLKKQKAITSSQV